MKLTQPVAETGGRLPHVGIATDKLTDLGGEQTLMIMFRMNHRGTPVTVLARLALLSEAMAYDADHEGSGLAIFNMVTETDSGVLRNSAL